MKLLNMSGPQDLMALLVRRKWWIILPFVALSCAVLVLTPMLPKVYVSEALIQIQQRDIPSDLVRDLLAGSTESRLSVIEQHVKSRDNLTQIVREFGSEMTEYQGLNMDDTVEKLRKQIGLIFPANGQPVTFLKITFQDRSPVLAQKIALRITDMFIKEDTDTRAVRVSGNVDFLSAEVDKAADLLRASDAKMKFLKRQYLNELPSQLEANLRRLEGLDGAQGTLSEQLILVNDYKRKIEQQIAETPPEIPKPVVVKIIPQARLDPKIGEYRNLQAQLKELRNSGLGEAYPTVLLVNSKIKKLKDQMTPEDLALAEKKDEAPPEAATAAVEMMPNPSYAKLTEQLNDLTIQIGLMQKRQDQTESGIAKINKHVDNEPAAEEKLNDIARENANLNKDYEQLRSKLAEVKLSETLENKQKNGQFYVRDKANLPETPAKPQTFTIELAGVLLSLLGGIAIGVVADVANQKMWTVSDVESMLGVVVLVEIPEIVTPSDLVAARKRRWIQVASFTAVTAAYGVGLYFVHHHQAFVVKQLGPYIQRFY